MTVVVIITHVYETVFLLADWDSARLRAALLEQERLRALPAELTDRLRIPPVTLSELLTNALKHNTVTSEQPLTLVLRLEGQTLVVENAFVPRPSSPVPGSSVGLSNLADRHRLATGQTVTWEEKNGTFEVRIPLVQ